MWSALWIHMECYDATRPGILNVSTSIGHDRRDVIYSWWKNVWQFDTPFDDGRKASAGKEKLSSLFC
jgi:hypothetical protein